MSRTISDAEAQSLVDVLRAAQGRHEKHDTWCVGLCCGTCAEFEQAIAALTRAEPARQGRVVCRHETLTPAPAVPPKPAAPAGQHPKCTAHQVGCGPECVPICEHLKPDACQHRELRDAASGLLIAMQQACSPGCVSHDGSRCAYCCRLLPLMDEVRAALAQPCAPDPDRDLATLFTRQFEWSLNTFGGDYRTAGLIAHLRKELLEIEADPTDAVEWIDVALLALDGAWRCQKITGARVAQLMVEKMAKNRARKWSVAKGDEPSEHVRDDQAPADAGEWELIDEGFLGEFAIADLNKMPLGTLVRVYRRRAGGGR